MNIIQTRFLEKKHIEIIKRRRKWRSAEPYQHGGSNLGNPGRQLS